MHARKSLCIALWPVLTAGVFAQARVLRAPRRRGRLRRHLTATPPGAGGGEACSAGASSAGACAVGSAHCADSKHGKSNGFPLGKSQETPPGLLRLPRPPSRTTKHVSMIHVPRRDVTCSCVQLHVQICPLKNEKKTTHEFTNTASETRVLTRSRQLLVF